MSSCCSGQTVVEEKQKRPRWEVADIFSTYGETYRREYSLPPSHQNVMKNIEACRTARLGGHREKCDCCGHERPAYNSCCDRHCPKCQSMKKARWLEARKRELLPVPYFHSVFTLPHELNPLTLCNKHVIFTILLGAVKETLLTFARNKGGTIGFLSFLHTWDQVLLDHFHIHCLIPAGMLSTEENSWIPFSNHYLFPVKALSKVFRGKFVDYLKKAYEKGDLVFPGRTARWETRSCFSKLIDQLWENEWVLYCKPPIRGPQQVLDYLARYIHRVAISNNRIVEVRDGRVSFTYRDRKNGDRQKVMTLEATEFIRRFMLHVLPGGFMRIRYCGFLANRSKRENLERLREILPFHDNPDEPERKTTAQLMLELTGIDVTRCPSCGVGTMRKVALIPPLNQGYKNVPYPEPHILDSS